VTAAAQFSTNIAAADALVAMYRELRQSRGLGARGRLAAAHLDLLWLPRSAVVASISALDAYVHAVVNDRLPHMFGQIAPPPEELCERLANLIPIKNATGFRDAIPLLSAQDTIARLLIKLRDESLAFLAFQDPEKIERAYGLIGHAGIFRSVSNIWPGPNNSAADIKRRLSQYVRRRNQIAHEGDLEAHGVSRPMQPDYAVGCSDFVRGLQERLNRVVYGA
jgi:hypothetical protein